MQVVLWFVSGLIVGFWTLWPAGYVLASFLELLEFDLSRDGSDVAVAISQAVLFCVWPLLFGVGGVWVGSRLARKRPTSEPPE